MTQGVAQELGWDRLSLVGDKAAPSLWRARAWLFAPFAAAAGLHLLLLAFIVGRLTDPVGMDRADPAGVTVEVLDAAAFDERYPSAIARKPAPADAQQPSPAIAAVAPAPASQPSAAAAADAPSPPATKPAADDAMALLNDPLPVPKPSLDLKLAPPALTTRSAQRPMTAAEFVARQLGGSAKERAGQIDDFTREVIRQLERSKPDSLGMIGQLVVTFVVSLTGTLENLQVARSSGDIRLDRLVVTAFRDVHVKIPPGYADIHDRTFEITVNAK